MENKDEELTKPEIHTIKYLQLSKRGYMDDYSPEVKSLVRKGYIYVDSLEKGKNYK